MKCVWHAHFLTILGISILCRKNKEIKMNSVSSTLSSIPTCRWLCDDSQGENDKCSISLESIPFSAGLNFDNEESSLNSQPPPPPPLSQSTDSKKCFQNIEFDITKQEKHKSVDNSCELNSSTTRLGKSKLLKSKLSSIWTNNFFS